MNIEVKETKVEVEPHIREYAESVNVKLDDFATSVMQISDPYFEKDF